MKDFKSTHPNRIAEIIEAWPGVKNLIKPGHQIQIRVKVIDHHALWYTVKEGENYLLASNVSTEDAAVFDTVPAGLKVALAITDVVDQYTRFPEMILVIEDQLGEPPSRHITVYQDKNLMIGDLIEDHFERRRDMDRLDEEMMQAADDDWQSQFEESDQDK